MTQAPMGQPALNAFAGGWDEGAQIVDFADLVGLAEIAIRAGVTNAAVANWAQRHDDFPPPVRDLACGTIYRWAQVAEWLTRHDMPHRRHCESRRPELSGPEVSGLVALARRTPRAQWAQVARDGGITLRHLQLLVTADAIGEEFGWFTRQRRQHKSEAV